MKIRLREVREQIRSVLREQTHDLDSLLTTALTTLDRDSWFVFLDALEEQMPETREKLAKTESDLENLWVLAQTGKFRCLDVPQIERGSVYTKFANICVDVIPAKVRLYFSGMKRFAGLELYDEEQPFGYFLISPQRDREAGFGDVVTFWPPRAVEMQDEIAEYDVEWLANSIDKKMVVNILNGVGPFSVYEEDASNDYRMLHSMWWSLRNMGREKMVALSNLVQIDGTSKTVPVPKKKSESKE